MVNNVYRRSFFLNDAYDTKCMQSKIQECLYIMLHMPCEMQEMHKGKLYMCYKGAPTHPTQENKHTPSSPRKRVKVAWSRSLVKMSASWSCVGTWIKAIFPFYTLSLRKWYLTSMCLVLEWSTGWYTPHQSHSWCMWSKGAERNNELRQRTLPRYWIEQHSTVCGKTKTPKKIPRTGKS
jgi:hypothetical protein